MPDPFGPLSGAERAVAIAIVVWAIIVIVVALVL
jgi:hypothetical protein